MSKATEPTQTDQELAKLSLEELKKRREKLAEAMYTKVPKNSDESHLAYGKRVEEGLIAGFDMFGGKKTVIQARNAEEVLGNSRPTEETKTKAKVDDRKPHAWLTSILGPDKNTSIYAANLNKAKSRRALGMYGKMARNDFAGACELVQKRAQESNAEINELKLLLSNMSDPLERNHNTELCKELEL